MRDTCRRRSTAMRLSRLLHRAPADALGLYITMLTRDEVFIDGINMQEESNQRAILAAPGGQKMIVDWFGMIVSHLRGQVTEDPGFGELTSEAEGILSATLPLLFGNLVERLQMLPASIARSLCRATPRAAFPAFRTPRRAGSTRGPLDRGLGSKRTARASRPRAGAPRRSRHRLDRPWLLERHEGGPVCDARRRRRGEARRRHLWGGSDRGRGGDEGNCLRGDVRRPARAHLDARRP